MPRAASSVALLAVLALAVSGCTGDLSDAVAGPDPEDAAKALAAGLADGDLADVAFVEADAAEVTEAYRTVVGRLGEVKPRVEVTDVEAGVDDDLATAELTWTWPLTDEGWTYASEVPMRLVDDEWRFTWSPAVVEPSLAEDELLDATEITPRRGDILGAGGAALVTQRPVLRLGVDRGRVDQAQAVAAARALAALTGIDAAGYVKQVRNAGPKAYVEAITYRRDAVPPAVASGYPGIRGVLALPETRALAPTREFAAPILGTVGPVTAEMVAKEPDTYRPGDTAGLSGLQARYDEQLRGTPGVVVDAVSDDPNGGDDERELYRAEATDGTPLQLTLDPALQRRAESLLAGERSASALVALRPSTGDLLVAANGPGTDGYNVATYGQYAPGSTFKTVSSLALLRSGLDPTSPLSCPAREVVDGKAFTNYSDYPAADLGRIPLRTAVASSCNTAFVSAADRVSGTALADAAASLGLGVDHDLGFPAYLGSVEEPASQTQAAADLIGQGKVLASPMAMAAVAGSVAAGRTVVPRMVGGVEVAPPDGVTALTGPEARHLREMLRAVVTEGSGRALADVPGAPVIAKTGTAEFGPADRLRTHAWMIAAQGDLAVAVFVEDGVSGSTTAGPILEAFLRAAG